MQLTGRILIYCGIAAFCIIGVQSACTDFTEYNTLMELLQNDRCDSADKVITLLNTLKHEQNGGFCKVDAINKLADHFKVQADNPQNCRCNSTNRRDLTTHTAAAKFCYDHDVDFKALYDQYFSNATHHQCRTHHSVWVILSRMRKAHTDTEHCQTTFIEIISDALAHQVNPCACSAPPVCHFDCGFHGRCYEDGCRCMQGYHGDKCEIVPLTTLRTLSPTTIKTSTTSMSTSKASHATTTAIHVITGMHETTTPSHATATTIHVSTGMHETTTPILKFTNTCVKYTTVLDMAEKLVESNPMAINCTSGNRSSHEAFVINNCGGLPSPSTWKPGYNVMAFCDKIPTYTPIASFENGRYSSRDCLSGIFLGCLHGQEGFKIAIQHCDTEARIEYVAGTDHLFNHNPFNYFTLSF